MTLFVGNLQIMLIYFKVGNYKSIKEPIVINFTAAAINEHQESNVLAREKNNLLKSVILHGPNASGKSKIIDALKFFRQFILHSAQDRHSTADIPTEVFELNSSTLNQPSFFETEFLIGKKTYRYGFEADTKYIHKEWLLEVKVTTESPIFLRIEQEFQINAKKFINADGLEKRTRKNALFLSVADQWNVPLAEDIIAWYDSIYIVNGLKDADFKTESTKMLKDSRYEDLINNMIRKADLGINSLEVINSPDEYQMLRFMNSSYDFDINTVNKNLNSIAALHNVYNDNGEVVNVAHFSIEKKESEGTQKFYNLSGIFLQAIMHGKLIIMDEMDARLHTLLTKAIIHLFNNADVKSGAQLLAVSHDTALLDGDILRRDQIYFVEKDSFSATKVTSLAEFKVRKETPYAKNYLEGKYGAIPFIENLETIIKDSNE